MATHSSILVWKIPWTEEPGELYNPCGLKESDMADLHMYLHMTSSYLLLHQNFVTLGNTLLFLLAWWIYYVQPGSSVLRSVM